MFPSLGNRLIELAHIPEGATVLDVGTGTGVVALMAAQKIGDTGRVIGAESQLSLDQLVQFRAEHLEEVGALAASNVNGIWLNVPAIFAIGRVANL